MLRKGLVLAATLLVVVGVAAADTVLPSTTITYSSLTFDPNSANVIPTNYGSIATLGVTNTNACYWNGTATGLPAGDLDNTAYACDSTKFAITFNPLGGTAWTLDSFDLAGYYGPKLFNVTVTDANGVLLWSSGDITVPGTGHVTLTPDVTFTSGITLTAGNSWDVGLSNISLTDPVPEPSSLALLACGALALYRRRR